MGSFSWRLRSGFWYLGSQLHNIAAPAVAIGDAARSDTRGAVRSGTGDCVRFETVVFGVVVVRSKTVPTAAGADTFVPDAGSSSGLATLGRAGSAWCCPPFVGVDALLPCCWTGFFVFFA